MKELSIHDYQNLVKDARVLEHDRCGGKVFLTPNNNIIKFFRTKNPISSNSIWPYAERFKKNANKLKAMGFTSVEVTETFFIPQQSRYAVIYPRLPGKTIRESLQDNPSDTVLIEHFATFIARLHNHGVYFRSLHFGNVVCQENGQFALIDVVDISFQKSNLSLVKRAKNFKHMFRYAQDVAGIMACGEEKVLDNYLQASQLRRASKYIFKKLFRNMLPTS